MDFGIAIAAMEVQLELLEGAALSRRSRWPVSQRGKGFVSAGEERPCYANPF
jgi:hypothetical protein